MLQISASSCDQNGVIKLILRAYNGGSTLRTALPAILPLSQARRHGFLDALPGIDAITLDTGREALELGNRCNSGKDDAKLNDANQNSIRRQYQVKKDNLVKLQT